MKNIFYSIFLFVSILSCKSNDKREDEKLNIVSDEVSIIVNDHLSESLLIFQDSMENTAGFLGWKNIRDYLGLGQYSLKERAFQTWEKTNNFELLESNLSRSLGRKELKLDKEKINTSIGNYGYKIPLSTFFIFIDFLVDLLLEILLGSVIGFIVVFIYVFYMFGFGGWKRWSKNRRGKVDALIVNVLNITFILAFITSIILAFISLDWSTTILLENLKSNMSNEIFRQIDSLG